MRGQQKERMTLRPKEQGKVDWRQLLLADQKVY